MERQDVRLDDSIEAKHVVDERGVSLAQGAQPRDRQVDGGLLVDVRPARRVEAGGLEDAARRARRVEARCQRPVAVQRREQPLDGPDRRSHRQVRDQRRARRRRGRGVEGAAAGAWGLSRASGSALL
jgi:hypothetical protein